MVKIIGIRLSEGEKGNFISLEVQGELEMVQSMQSGRFYATARRCLMPCTFKEEQAKELIGQHVRGSIVRVECEPYDFTVPETGEVIERNHRYEYTPEELPQHVLQPAETLLVAG